MLSSAFQVIAKISISINFGYKIYTTCIPGMATT